MERYERLEWSDDREESGYEGGWEEVVCPAGEGAGRGEGEQVGMAGDGIADAR